MFVIIDIRLKYKLFVVKNRYYANSDNTFKCFYNNEIFVFKPGMPKRVTCTCLVSCNHCDINMCACVYPLPRAQIMTSCV